MNANDGSLMERFLGVRKAYAEAHPGLTASGVFVLGFIALSELLPIVAALNGRPWSIWRRLSLIVFRTILSSASTTLIVLLVLYAVTRLL